MASISDVEAGNIARFLGRKGRDVTIAEVKAMPQVQVDKIKKQMRGIGKNKGGMITKQYMNPVTIVDNLR